MLISLYKAFDKPSLQFAVPWTAELNKSTIKTRTGLISGQRTFVVGREGPRTPRPIRPCSVLGRLMNCGGGAIPKCTSSLSDQLN